MQTTINKKHFRPNLLHRVVVITDCLLIIYLTIWSSQRKTSIAMYEYMYDDVLADALRFWGSSRPSPTHGISGDYLYHYTSAVGAAGIMSSGYIWQSARFGRQFPAGVYLTDLQPSTQTQYSVLRNNYGTRADRYPLSAQRAIRIPVSLLDSTKLYRVYTVGTRRIWRYSDTVHTRDAIVLTVL